jgi:hypothetical protein
MRRFAAALLCFLCGASLCYGQMYRLRYGQVPLHPNPADYTIRVHISAIHFRTCLYDGRGVCYEQIFADASLDGKKVELTGSVAKRDLRLLVPGDYFARLSEKKPRDGGKAVMFQEYFLLLPDKTAWACEVTGLSE